MKALFSKESLKSFAAALILISVLVFSCQYKKQNKIYNPFTQELKTPVGVVNLKTLKENKITLLYFGFLACPDVCPTTLSTMTTVFKSLPQSKLDKINFFFISLDPERDTLLRMKEYAAHFHPKVMPAVLSLTDLELFTTYFGIAFLKVPLKSQMGYTIDHSTQVVVLSPEGKILTPILHSYTKLLLIGQINQLLKDYFNL